MREYLIFIIAMLAELLVIIDLKQKLDKLTEDNINLRAHLSFVEKMLSEKEAEEEEEPCATI